MFEVVSPGNTQAEILEKIDFYEEYGVEEFYLYDPDCKTLRGFRRQDDEWIAIPNMIGWVSPCLNVEFGLQDGKLVLHGPDGRRFVSYVELVAQRQQSEAIAQREHNRAEQQTQRAEQAQQREEQEKQRAEQEKQRAEQEKQRANRLAEKLRALGVDPDSV